MEYDSDALFRNLMALSLDGSLYGEFSQKSWLFYEATVKLGEAKATNSPYEIRHKEDLDGRYEDLERLVTNKINPALKSHNPPLQTLPIQREELTLIITTHIQAIFSQRRTG